VSAAGATWCPNCWGAGCIFHEAANGEGLIPVRCERCGGTGLHTHDEEEADG